MLPCRRIRGRGLSFPRRVANWLFITLVKTLFSPIISTRLAHRSRWSPGHNTAASIHDRTVFSSQYFLMLYANVHNKLKLLSTNRLYAYVFI